MALSSSIAMCTYNGEQYLSAQLESLLQQTVMPQELIVCDDGSTDNTIAILKDFASRAPFEVQIIQNPQNLGYIKNFEKAGKMCHGDIVFFADQDDVWFPDKIERVTKVMESHEEVGLVLLRAGYIDGSGNVISPPRRLQKRERLLDESPEIDDYCLQNHLIHWVTSWQGCNMAYRNSLKEIIYPIENAIGHDTWILLLLGVISQTKFITRPTMYHRLHSSNLSRLSSSSKNILGRLHHSISRHCSAQRSQYRGDLFEHLLGRIQLNPDCILHPELIPVFERFRSHFHTKAEIQSRFLGRIKLIYQELSNGNYAFCERGIKDLLMDLITIPNKKSDSTNK